MSRICCSKFLFAVLTVATGCGFQHGFHDGVTNIISHAMLNWLNSSKMTRLKGKKSPDHEIQTIWSTVTAVFSIGGFLGALLTGYFSERYGRKRSLIWNNFIMLGAVGLIIWSKQAQSPEMFITGRFLAGIYAGLNSGLSQIYLIEISPDSIRGFVAGLFPVFIDVGILISQLEGIFFGTQTHWHMIFLIPLIPTCFQVAFLIMCPESPKHLIIGKDNEDEAENVLIWLRGKENAVKCLKSIIEEDNLVKELHAKTLKRLFTDVKFRTPLIICVILNVGHQLCGINSITYFSSKNFEELGLTKVDADILTISLTIVMMIGDAISIFFVDRAGRRKLLLISFMGMAIATIGMTIAMIVAHQETPSLFWIISSIMFHFIYIILFSVGVGTIPRYLTAEMFSHSTRPVAVSLCASVDWLSSFLVCQAFLPVKDVIGYSVFGVFIVLDFFFFFFFNMYLPETAKLSSKSLIKLFDYLE